MCLCVCADTENLLIGDRCNLLGMCVIVIPKTVWILVTFDLACPSELFSYFSSILLVALWRASPIYNIECVIFQNTRFNLYISWWLEVLHKSDKHCERFVQLLPNFTIEVKRQHEFSVGFAVSLLWWCSLKVTVKRSYSLILEFKKMSNTSSKTVTQITFCKCMCIKVISKLFTDSYFNLFVCLYKV